MRSTLWLETACWNPRLIDEGETLTRLLRGRVGGQGRG